MNNRTLCGIIILMLFLYGTYAAIMGDGLTAAYAWTVFLLVCAAGIFAFNETPATPTPTYSRAAALARSPSRYTEAEWLALCAFHNHRCLACGRKRKLTADHIVPLYLGGSDDITNIQPLCKPCNSSKGAQTIDYRARP